jgi:hypothetical protein
VEQPAAQICIYALFWLCNRHDAISFASLDKVVSLA